MRTTIFAAMALAAFGLNGAACAQGPLRAAPAPDMAQPAREAADMEAIRAVGKQWKALYDAERFAEIPDLYTEDTMVMPRGRARIEGREKMRRAIGGLAAGRKIDIELHERDLHVFGDYAWFVSDFRVTYSQAGPTATKVEYGRSLVIYRRDADGRWRIHRDMDNPAPNWPAPNGPVPNRPAPAVAAANTPSGAP